MEYSSVEEAINKSRYSEKIKFIQRGPIYCSRGVMERSANYIEYPNCWGATLFIVGGEDRLLSELPHTIRNSTAIIGNEKGINTSFIPLIFSRPGHICLRDMTWFLMKQCKELEEKSEGCIIGEYSNQDRTNRSLIHTMIYLGIVQGSDYVYTKEGLSGVFVATDLVPKNNVKGYRYFRYTF